MVIALLYNKCRLSPHINCNVAHKKEKPEYYRSLVFRLSSPAPLPNLARAWRELASQASQFGKIWQGGRLSSLVKAPVNYRAAVSFFKYVLHCTLKVADTALYCPDFLDLGAAIEMAGNEAGTVIFRSAPDTLQ
jgi:hypothetical protein